MKSLVPILFAGALWATSVVPNAGATFRLLERASVDSSGVHLDEIVVCDPAAPLPHLRLADAPRLGQSLTLTQPQLIATENRFIVPGVPTAPRAFSLPD